MVSMDRFVAGGRLYLLVKVREFAYFGEALLAGSHAESMHDLREV